MTPAAYDLADRLFAAAPWRNMMEFHLIALIDPATGEKHHISLMGANGNHMALALYLGLGARVAFNTLQETAMPPEDHVRLIMETPQLQCAFSARGDMMKSELAAIKSAGKKYRGENWPSFRRFMPGRAPAPANPQELALLCHAIGQALEVSKNLHIGDDTVGVEKGTRTVLTRRFDGNAWLTEWTPDDTSHHKFPTPAPSELLVEKILRHPKAKPLEIAFHFIPSPIGKSRENAIFPYFLLIVEPTSSFILGFEMLSVDNVPFDSMPAAAIDGLLRILDRNRVCPVAFHVASPITAIMLHHTATALGIEIQVREHLPALERAMHSMLRELEG